MFKKWHFKNKRVTDVECDAFRCFNLKRNEFSIKIFPGSFCPTSITLTSQRVFNFDVMLNDKFIYVGWKHGEKIRAKSSRIKIK